MAQFADNEEEICQNVIFFFTGHSNRDIPEEKKIEEAVNVNVTIWLFRKILSTVSLIIFNFSAKGQIIQATLAQERELSHFSYLWAFRWVTSNVRVRFTDHEILM